MNIVIPAYINDESKLPIILDQIYVAIESYYFYENTGTFFIFSNSLNLIKAIEIYKDVFNRDVQLQYLDFKKVWDDLKLPINDNKARKEFIVSKLVIPFVFEESYLLMDWDILTTGYIDPSYIESDKIRLFNSKFYDGLTLNQISHLKGLHPENDSVGRFRWMNSGMVYSPKGLVRQIIQEYWYKFNDLQGNSYKNIYLFDTIGDELIYNLMKIDEDKRVEECNRYNINVVLRNFYYDFSNIKSMYEFGSSFPNVLNIHFAVGHVKPYNVVLDQKGNLNFHIELEKYTMDKDNIRWLFNLSEHRMGSFHYNALLFSIIWQYTRYKIKERLNPMAEILSGRYSEYFDRIFIGEKHK
jgi:hypothetical protein